MNGKLSTCWLFNIHNISYEVCKNDVGAMHHVYLTLHNKDSIDSLCFFNHCVKRSLRTDNLVKTFSKILSIEMVWKWGGGAMILCSVKKLDAPRVPGSNPSKVKKFSLLFITFEVC